MYLETESNDIIEGSNGNDIIGGPGGDHGDEGLSGRPYDEDLDGEAGTFFVAGHEGSDTFVFHSHYPTGPIDWGANFEPIPVLTIGDFNPAQDTFAFDAKGLGNDNSGANFINHGDPQAGSTVDTFYEGNASGASGEHVVVITDQSFASGSDATSAISGERGGDIIVYHNADTRTVELAYVTSPDHVDVFAHLSEVGSVSDLANMHLTPSDFTFV
ncbi:hypothetical protein [Rhizobium grahamii]|uniref:Ca-binding protein, NodO2 n=1 Tax=Rhizobium grahamii CCGE 502 TaxID=990285 RepID=S3H6M6_9HYPH|nr:hypothetical protein [Rhizobium grahamii]EPE93915.1 Ca-binding protein, NodO2 [Rhizobium grahamii CCGE 502]